MATDTASMLHDKQLLTTGEATSAATPTGIFFVPSIYDHTSLVDHLKDMAENQLPSEKLEHLCRDDFATALGKQAFELAQQGVVYDTDANCCEESEPRLIRALERDAITNARYKSPLILTHNRNPVAIAKRYGERTIYGLENVPKLNIYKGLFHAATNSSAYIDAPPASRHAWQVALADAPLGAIRPLRFSTFVTPPEMRQELIPVDYSQHGLTPEDMNAPLTTKHSTLQDYAYDALKKAVLL